MNNKQDTNNNQNNCYVFSQSTLDNAVQDWLDVDNKKTSESVLIGVAALPWFLKHLKQTPPIYMFTYDALIAEMNAWKSDQISEYPHQEQRINETCEHLLNFFQSDVIIEHKMMITT